MTEISPRVGKRRPSPYDRTDPFSSGRVGISATALVFGRMTMAPADIVAARIVTDEKSGLLGSICGFVVFLAMAVLILQMIVGQIFPFRTLVVVIMLGCVGLASVQDTWREQGDGFFSLILKTAAGEEVEAFATSERSEIELVWRRLSEVLDPRVFVQPDGTIPLLDRLKRQPAWR